MSVGSNGVANRTLLAAGVAIAVSAQPTYDVGGPTVVSVQESVGLYQDFTDSGLTLPGFYTFSRASAATYFDSSGTLQTAASGVLRAFAYQDHDPTTLAPLGVRIEEQRTNQVRSSEAISNSDWVDLSALQTFTLNSTDVVDPRGTNKATKVVAGGASGLTARSVLTAASGANTASIFVYVPSGQGINGWRFACDYQDVEAGGNSDSTVFDRWVRVSSTATLASSRTYCDFNIVQSSGSVFGAGKVYYIFGAQTELGAFATSYIPTTTAAATRLADSLSITGSAFTSIWNQNEGTIVVNAMIQALTSAIPTVYRVDDGTDDERIFVRNNGSGVLFAVVVDGGATQASLGTGNTLAAGAFFKHAFRVQANNFASSFNGAAVLTDTSGTMPTVTTLRIGSSLGGDYLNGTIKSLVIYRSALSGAQLQALTV